MGIIEQFKNLLDPSNTLGAFLISICASFVTGVFTEKKITKIQKAKTVCGDMMQDSKVYKR